MSPAATTTKAQLTPVSWGGQLINDGTVYTAKITANDTANGSNPNGRAVFSQVPGGYPVAVRGQVTERRLALQVTLVRAGAFTQADLETLRSWFDPLLGFQTLIVTDPASATRSISAYPESFVPIDALGHSYRVTFSAAGPWKAVANSGSSVSIIASGQTQAIVNAGDTRAYPSFTITPVSAKTNVNNYAQRIPLIIANRSELPVTDPVGDGWPVDVVNDTLNTSALNGASQLLASMNDLRILLSGQELNRYLYPAAVDATTQVWCNLQFRARKTAILTAAMASGASPANGTNLAVSNPGGLAGWPDHGFFLAGTELIHYADRTDLSFINITRGSRGTTAAAHGAALTIYWVEHPFLDLIFNYTGAGSPPADTDRQPAITFAGSNNSTFLWNATFFNDTLGTAQNRRSAAWQRSYTDEGPNSRWTGLGSPGGGLYWSDQVPSSQYPNFNNMYMDFPYGLIAGSALTANVVIARLWRLLAYGVDLGGNESLLVDAPPGTTAFTTGGLLNAIFHARLVGRVGMLTGDVSAGSDIDAAIPLITALATGPYTSLSFVCDTTEANFIGAVVRAKNSTGGTATLAMAIYTDAGGIPGEYVAGSFVGITLTNAYATYVATPTLFGTGTLGRLEAGKRYHLCYFQGAGTGTVTISQRGRSQGRHYLVLASDIFPASTAWGGVLVDGLTQTQIDAPNRTGDTIGIGSILALFDTARTPSIVLGATEIINLVQARLKNETTGDYIDIFHPMTLSQTLVIDCENRRVTDGATGEDVPFAISASNAADWLYCNPGSNTFSWTEVGVVATTLAWDLYAGYL